MNLWDFCVFMGYLFWACDVKMCQYATNDDKKFMRSILVYVKDVQIGLENNYLDEKIQRKGGRNGKMHALSMGCTMES